MSASKVERAVRHYQKDIEQPGQHHDRVLHCIEKLYRLPVTVQHLQDTGVGRTVNALRKGEGEVATAARALVSKWKQMVAEEEDAREQLERQQMQHQNGDDEEDDDEEEEDDDENEEVKNEREPSPEPVKIYEDRKEKHGKERHKHDRHMQENEELNRDEHLEYRKRKYEEMHNRREYSKKYKNHSDDSDHDGRQSPPKPVQTRESPETYQDSEPEFHIDEPNLSEESEEEEKPAVNQNPAIEKPAKESSKSHSKHHSGSSKSRHEEKKKEREHRDKHKEKDHHKHRHKSEKSESEEKKKSKHHEEKHKEKEKKKEKHEEVKHKSEEKNKERSKGDREHKSKDESHKSSSNSKSKSSNSESKPKKVIKVSEEGIGCESGASFAEALGMMNPTRSPSAKKKSSSSTSHSAQSSSSKHNSSSSSSSSKSHKKEDSHKKEREDKSSKKDDSFKYPHHHSLLAPDTKLAPLPPLTVSITSLPEISPNYVPRPPPKLYDSIVPSLSEEAALHVAMNTKNQRTKVFSGNRIMNGIIPSLYELCCIVLQENIDALEFTGGVPYELLKPVIEKATPHQLFNLEHYNPYLIEDTDELWHAHCLKNFRMQKRQEMESWREMYLRCTDEQEAKLKSLTANIKMAQDKSTPVRQTKLAYLDSVVKPPRNIARKQAIYGTARKPAVSPAARVAALATGNVVKAADVKGAGASTGNVSMPRSSGFIKPKKAPLMQKALQLIKGRYKR